MEGPFDKVITFATVDDLGVDVPIPGESGASTAAQSLPPDLEYLQGHTLGELLRVEYQATSAALAQMGRMSCTLRFPDLSAESLGEAIMFFQLATGYAGLDPMRIRHWPTASIPLLSSHGHRVRRPISSPGRMTPPMRA